MHLLGHLKLGMLFRALMKNLRLEILASTPLLVTEICFYHQHSFLGFKFFHHTLGGLGCSKMVFKK